MFAARRRRHSQNCRAIQGKRQFCSYLQVCLCNYFYYSKDKKLMNNLGRSSTRSSNAANTAAGGNKKKQFHVRLLALTAMLASFALPQLRAQIVETGTITGIVHDKSGAVIAGAHVTTRNAATGLANNSVTDSEGLYVSPPLPPGDYNMEFEAAGFSKLQEHVRLEVGQRVAADGILSIGEASQTVTVEATAQLLESETSTVSN